VSHRKLMPGRTVYFIVLETEHILTRRTPLSSLVNNPGVERPPHRDTESRTPDTVRRNAGSAAVATCLMEKCLPTPCGLEIPRWHPAERRLALSPSPRVLAFLSNATLRPRLWLEWNVDHHDASASKRDTHARLRKVPTMVGCDSRPRR
jgi:hypothetical protein